MATPWRSLGSSALLVFVGSVLNAQDLVVLKNGDQLHGTIKAVERDVLKFDAAYGRNVFEISWANVVRIETKGKKSVELTNGTFYTGTVATNPEDPNGILIGTATGPVKLSRSDLDSLNDIAKQTLGRLHAGADVGFSLIRASGTKQLSFGGRTNYTGERWLASGNLHVVRNSQSGASLLRLDSSASLGLFFRGRWFGLASANFLSSDEQQLTLRSTLVTGVGKYIRRTRSTEISALAGLGWSTEHFSTPNVPAAQSVEAALLANLNFYSLARGKIDSLSTFTLYPGLTEAGRLRYNLISELRLNLPKKLHFNLRLSNSYDNRPQTGAPKVDYVFTTGLGWAR